MALERTSASVISSACSPVSGWETSRLSTSHPQVPGIHRVQGVLHVDKGGVAPPASAPRRCSAAPGWSCRGLGPVDLHDPPPGQPADAPAPGPRTATRWGWPPRSGPSPAPGASHRALAKLLLDLGQRRLQRLGLLLRTPLRPCRSPGLLLYPPCRFLLNSVVRSFLPSIIKEKAGKTQRFSTTFFEHLFTRLSSPFSKGTPLLQLLQEKRGAVTPPS